METQFEGVDFNKGFSGIKFYCEPKLRSTNFNMIMILVLSAKKEGNYEKLELLLQSKIYNVNHLNEKGWSALDLACCNSNTFSSTEIVKLLLEQESIEESLKKYETGFLSYLIYYYNNGRVTKETVEIILNRINILFFKKIIINGEFLSIFKETLIKSKKITEYLFWGIRFKEEDIKILQEIIQKNETIQKIQFKGVLMDCFSHINFHLIADLLKFGYISCGDVKKTKIFYEKLVIRKYNKHLIYKDMLPRKYLYLIFQKYSKRHKSRRKYDCSEHKIVLYTNNYPKKAIFSKFNNHFDLRINYFYVFCI